MALNFFAYQPPEFELPHPPLSIAVLLVVEEAIRAAWRILAARTPDDFDMHTALEETINHHLRETLQDLVWNRDVVDGFDAEQVSCVTSAEEVRDFSGQELKKKPDMIVKLVGMPSSARPSQYGIFIECKPVDKDHSPVTCYCRKGIVRFIDGRYAWAMQEAMMVGYFSGTQEPVTTLSSAFAKCQAKVMPVGAPTNCPKSVPQSGVPTAITRHSREFVYVETGVKAPGILLRHVWLKR